MAQGLRQVWNETVACLEVVAGDFILGIACAFIVLAQDWIGGLGAIEPALVLPDLEII